MSMFFSGGLFDVIPDSAIYYWDPSAFSTGDSVWTDEVAAVDMSVTGDPQSTTYSNGDPAVAGDGVDDHGLAPQANIGSLLNNFALETPVETTQTASEFPIGAFDGDNGIFFAVNTDGDYNNVTGEITAHIIDTTSNTLSVDTGGAVNINDGARHSVSVNVIDAANNNIELIVDGNTYSNIVRSISSPSFADLTVDMAYYGRNLEGSVQDRYNGKLGPIVWHDTDISGQTI